MRYLRFIVYCLTASWLAACGGSNSISTTPVLPPTSATESQSIPAGGGTATVKLGSQSASVTVPSNAFSAGATLKLTLYLPSALPVTFAKARKIESVPTGATPLIGLIIDAGGATLNAPLQVSFTGPAGPTTGTSVLLSGYANSAFDDVATTSFNGTSYTEATNVQYPGITLASQTQYVLYSVATTAVAPPTATVTVSGPATVSTAAQATYTATETTANGFPFFSHTFTYSLDNATLGTIATTANTGVLTGGGIGGLGNVIATDTAVSTFTGKLPVGVTSSRPGTTGLTEQYTGTLTESDANNDINPAPSPSPIAFNSTAQATVNVTTGTDANGNVLFTAAESDAASLTTLTSSTVSTVAYQTQPGGSVNVRALKTVATESTGVIYENDFGATNGLLTILPETPATFTNDASDEYKETDPGVGITGSGAQGVTTDKVVASSGAYTSNIVEPNTQTAAPTTDVATENADFSGTLALNSIDPTFELTFGAPASGNLVVTFVDPSQSLNSPTTIPSWIPSTLATPSVETDAITAATSLPSDCSPTVGTTGPWTLTTQNLTVADSVNGTLETRTTQSYDAAGIGTVCSIVSDTIQTFYDYSGQEGSYLLFFANSATVPVTTTTMSETLSLHTSNAATITSKTRSPQSIGGGSFALLPTSLVSTRVQYLARKRAAAKIAHFRTNNTLLLRGGLAK